MKLPKPVAARPGAVRTSLDRYTLYRRMLAGDGDGLVYWWYFGTTIVEVDGLPPMPAIDAATLMVYRTETLGAARFAIHWDEVGCFFDYATGEAAEAWVNPLTGESCATPRSFAEGPARYEIARAGDDVAISLVQPGAFVRSIELDWQQRGARIALVQRESKVRGYPNVDGSLPSPDSKAGFEACTELAFVADADGGAAEGAYEFALAGAPPWMHMPADAKCRTVTRGIIRKTAAGDAPAPRAAAHLRDLFPEFFERYAR
jgi:hypothetical protein